MRGIKHSAQSKDRAIELRRLGKNYNEIMKIVPAPKSTLATWFINEKIPSPFTKEMQLAHLRKIQPEGAKARRQQRIDRLEKVKSHVETEVKSYPFQHKGFLKSILAMLYWAEGTKHSHAAGALLTNTDPYLMSLYATLLRKCYDIDESKFSVRLHLHYYHKIKETKLFWSNLLDIPEKQFTSVYIKKRSRNKRFRTNFKGICFLYYGNGNIREELMATGKALHDIVVNSKVRP